MKRLLSLLLLLPASLLAAEVSSKDAARAAKAWVDRGYAMGKLPAGREIAGVDEVADPATGARLLVAKFEGGGYVVLSADDLVDPVLAFSETGDGIDPDDANPFWALLRGDIAAREAAAGVERGKEAETKGGGTATRGAKSAELTAAQSKWAALLADEEAKPQKRGAVAAPSDLRVDSFVDSRWDQYTHNGYDSGQNCYNYYTPNNYVCGCVATAGAQIMRYWQWPQTAVTPMTQTCTVDGSSVSKTMYGGVYEWASMPLVPADGVTDPQCQAIGKLTYDIGVSVGMNWKSGGSGSNIFGLVLRFKDTFGYANAVAARFDSGHPFSLDEFKAIVIPNCDARVPIGVGVEDTANHGHAVLADGYGWTDGAFCIHVNCGWGGSGDAWYVPPDIEDYTIIDQVVFNVFPSQTGSVFSGRVLDASGAPVAGASVVLQRGSSTVDTATSDANGIYAFVAVAGSYLVTATKDGISATIGVELGATTGVFLIPGGTGSWRTGSYATIGNSYGNDIALTGMAATPAPVFDPAGCLFYPSTNVTIACADPSATIHYTIDGSAPTETSARYTGPIFVDDDVTIKARAFSSGKNPSPIVAETYTYDAAQGAPKGDYFADPIKISGMNGSRVIEDNANYTVEPGEPYHTRRPSGSNSYTYSYQYRTVWYQWTAPGTGTMTFRTSCSGGGYRYPTFIAIYTGDTLSLDNRQAFAYEYDKSSYVTTLEMEVSQGTTYRIVGMMGYDGSGTFTLTWSGDLTVQKTPYETWADDNVSGGAPDAVTGGVENAFRYVFDKPDESFSPILSAAPGPSDGSVLRLPAVVNTDGVTLKVLSTTNLADWVSAVETNDVTVGQDGTVTLPVGGPVRFFRLKAEVE